MGGVIIGGGLVVVFIATLSIMLVFDVLIKSTAKCLNAFAGCSAQADGAMFLAGLALVTVFVILIMSTLYMMFTRASKDSFLK
ncbi:MAG: hypothetical protein HY518_01710 [Candidatus Aenigmarchaeota archaeon]|nr:hypothetical protein [Candidatus Aenigmarchaeota archaeon]